MQNQEATKMIDCINNILDNDTKLLNLKDMDKITLNSLVERHLVSKEFITNSNNRAVLLNNDCTLSVMINFIGGIYFIQLLLKESK
jgi:protein-arginine kinase